jgi:hypothetical protein
VHWVAVPKELRARRVNRLRLLPGTQHWSERRVEARLRAMAEAAATEGRAAAAEDQPGQVVVDLSLSQTLMWYAQPLPATQQRRRHASFTPPLPACLPGTWCLPLRCGRRRPLALN